MLRLTKNSNTAQLLSSLAEAIAGSRNSPENNRNCALNYLQEALELFQRCFNLQEYEYSKAEEDNAQVAGALAADDDNTQDTPTANTSDVSEEEIWASVEEPITRETLVDSAVGQLNTLTAICGLDDFRNHGNLAWVEEYYRDTLHDKIKFYVDNAVRRQEASLAKAKFVAAVSDTAFRSGRIDLPTYERELNAAFSNPEFDLTNDAQGLCDTAEAELTFSASIQDSITDARAAEPPQVAATCWRHITKALDSLTAASKLPDAYNLRRIHLRRGDCEMTRLHLGEAPLSYDLAINSMPTLLKNAGIYYRGARTIAIRSKSDEEEQTDADIKEAVVLTLSGDAQKLKTLMREQSDDVETVAKDMRDEKLLGEESLQKITSLAL